MRETVKTALQLLVAGSLGFWLGGRYVGGLAVTTYYGDAPDWLLAAKETMTFALVMCLLCVVGWIVLDYRGESV
jgi:hypothetical protein